MTDSLSQVLHTWKGMKLGYRRVPELPLSRQHRNALGTQGEILPERGHRIGLPTLGPLKREFLRWQYSTSKRQFPMYGLPGALGSVVHVSIRKPETGLVYEPLIAGHLHNQHPTYLNHQSYSTLIPLRLLLPA
jgi:hypothetical protein